MKDIQLTIFDCDGVLVDSEAISNAVVAEMLSDQGLPMTAEEGTRHFAGTSMKYIHEFFYQKTGLYLPDDFEEIYRGRSFEAFERDLQAVEGVREAIQQIDLPRCVGSNGPLKKVRFNLTLTNLLPFFGDNLFSAYEIGRWKPLPDLYLHAAAQMGVAPAHCVVIEDSVSGVQAAKAAGIRVLGFAGHGSGDGLREAGAEVFHKMSELPDRIAALQ
ncbi:MAG: HAD family hydrolase [Bacteroidota bacterium]